MLLRLFDDVTIPQAPRPDYIDHLAIVQTLHFRGTIDNEPLIIPGVAPAQEEIGIVSNEVINHEHLLPRPGAAA